MSVPTISLDEAWVIGVFEGEGTIVIRNRANEHGRNSGKSVYVGIVMTDEDVVRKVHKIMSVGNITGPYIRKSDPDFYKPAWKWTVHNAKDVTLVLEKFAPYLGQRRRAKAIEAMKHLAGTRAIKGPVTQCINGHLYNKENTYIVKKTGFRYCRPCHKNSEAKRRARLLLNK